MEQGKPHHKPSMRISLSFPPYYESRIRQVASQLHFQTPYTNVPWRIARLESRLIYGDQGLARDMRNGGVDG
jgi:hypothetical protein